MIGHITDDRLSHKETDVWFPRINQRPKRPIHDMQ